MEGVAKACCFECDLRKVPVAPSHVAIHGLLKAVCRCRTAIWHKRGQHSFAQVFHLISHQCMERQGASKHRIQGSQQRVRLQKALLAKVKCVQMCRYILVVQANTASATHMSLWSRVHAPHFLFLHV